MKNKATSSLFPNDMLKMPDRAQQNQSQNIEIKMPRSE